MKQRRLHAPSGKDNRLFPEIFILKDIGRCADQPEADLRAAGLARRKSVTAEHDHFMSAAMSGMMNHFINPGLPDDLAGAEHEAGSPLTTGVRPRFSSALDAEEFVPPLRFPK